MRSKQADGKRDAERGGTRQREEEGEPEEETETERAEGKSNVQDNEGKKSKKHVVATSAAAVSASEEAKKIFACRPLSVFWGEVVQKGFDPFEALEHLELGDVKGLKLGHLKVVQARLGELRTPTPEES